MTAFSLREALTTNLELGIDDTTLALFDGRRGSGWKNVVVVGGPTFLWDEQTGGIAMETAEVEAISVS